MSVFHSVHRRCLFGEITLKASKCYLTNSYNPFLLKYIKSGETLTLGVSVCVCYFYVAQGKSEYIDLSESFNAETLREREKIKVGKCLTRCMNVGAVKFTKKGTSQQILVG